MKKTLALVMALCMILCSFSALAETAEPTYTYNLALSTFPTNWNPHQYKTATDNDTVLSWISDSLFGFDLNETEDSYAMVNRMSVGEPVDVTADYVGEQWGIEEGATGYAWKYTLRDDLKWQDGTPITAETYVYSVMQQLNPVAQNYRADSLYSGSVVLVNAEAYAKQGINADTALSSYIAITGSADLADMLANHGTEKGYINWANSFGDTYDFTTKAWTGTAENAVVETPLTIAELYDFYTVGAGAAYATWADAATLKEWANDELFVKYVYPETAFEDVGIKAVSDNEVVFILEQSLTGFQLKYNLDISLVHKELYEACESVVDGVYTNSYGTSADTTISYGPYMLTSFQSDKEIQLAKNPNWYGWNVEENEGLYQTTNISYVYVAEPSTAFEMFLAGQLDSRGLDKDHIEEYLSSEYTYFSEGASVFAMAVNPDLEALTANQAAAGENINKTILTVKEFRIGLALGIDRSAFILATSPINAPAFALYGNTIIGDPETATFYRSTDEAKKVLTDFWSLTDEIGEGKLYATADDAIDSISGYNPSMAKEYFDKAYDIAIKEGLMDEDDVIEIIIGIPAPSVPFYNNGYDFIVNNYTELAKGTKLEGKITFKRDDTVGNSFGDALRNNQVDMLFGVGWNGSEFDPYSLVEAYVSPNYQYDASWDASAEMVTIELDGENYTGSVVTWYKCINNKPATLTKDDGTTVDMVLPYSDDAEIAAKRLKVLCILEGVVLQNYDFIPLMNDASAVLKGMQIEYYLEEEVFPMGYGGVKYMTYNYTDAEWDAFVASQGGVLNYK